MCSQLSQNKQRLFPYTAVTGAVLQKVVTSTFSTTRMKAGVRCYISLSVITCAVCLCILSLFVTKNAFLPTLSRSERNARVIGTCTKRSIASAVLNTTYILDVYDLFFSVFAELLTGRKNISNTILVINQLNAQNLVL